MAISSHTISRSIELCDDQLTSPSSLSSPPPPPSAMCNCCLWPPPWGCWRCNLHYDTRSCSPLLERTLRPVERLAQNYCSSPYATATFVRPYTEKSWIFLGMGNLGTNQQIWLVGNSGWEWDKSVFESDGFKPPISWGSWGSLSQA